MELTGTFGGAPYSVLAGNQLKIATVINYDLHYETCQGNSQMVFIVAKAFQT